MTGFPLDSDCFQFLCSEHPDAGQLGCGGVCGGWPWWVLSRGWGRGVLSSQRLHTAVRSAVRTQAQNRAIWGLPPGSAACLFRVHQARLVFSRGERLEQEVENM